jgi:pimeloyl-ACP methyl ester carboxylesterase
MMHEQSGFVDVNGTRLYYEIAGRGPPLILIHGFTLDTRMWDDQFEAFSHHYRVLRYDIRGFGKSALPVQSEPYAHHEDLKALLDHLEISQAFILGLSMGGGIAIDFTLEYPKVTKTLVAVDSTLGGFQWTSAFGELLKALSVEGRTNGVEAAKTLWLESPLFRSTSDNPTASSHLVTILSHYSGWHWVNTNPIHRLDPPAIERLDEIQVPTLTIIGEHDLPDFHTIAETLERTICNARKVTLQGVGHMSSMEAPEKFNETVLNFLADI